ncbi:hypothetical protein ACFU76_04400 [Streptomyces sp. NPDC057539]|uniref:hypothetical protein n=1 Tax=Streptomyces sp. NPDC057539 TaxID=3346159 RepID=UPI0036AB8BD5
MSDFAKGFRLHALDGETYDGALFPSGRGVIADHPERGFSTVAISMDAISEKFPGCRIEWDGDEPDNVA